MKSRTRYTAPLQNKWHDTKLYIFHDTKKVSATILEFWGRVVVAKWFWVVFKGGYWGWLLGGCLLAQLKRAHQFLWHSDPYIKINKCNTLSHIKFLCIKHDQQSFKNMKTLVLAHSYFSLKTGGRGHNDTMTLNIIIRLAVKSLSV